MDAVAYKKSVTLLNKKSNIYPHASAVTREHRNERFGHKSGVVWLTGLSGSGKSTVATGVEKMMFEKGYMVTVLDGDTIRSGLNSDLGFCRQSREENLRRAAEVASLFASSGHIVLATLISPHQQGREFVKQIVHDNFHMVYIKADVEACVQRDPKGLYQKAKAGGIEHFTGIGQSYEEPQSPNLVIDTTDQEIRKSQLMLMGYIESQFIHP